MGSRTSMGSVRCHHDPGVHIHGAGLVHADGSLVHDAEAVLEGIDTGEAQRGQFTETVAGQGSGLECPAKSRYCTMAYSMVKRAGCCHRVFWRSSSRRGTMRPKDVELGDLRRSVHPLLG